MRDHVEIELDGITYAVPKVHPRIKRTSEGEILWTWTVPNSIDPLRSRKTEGSIAGLTDEKRADFAAHMFAYWMMRSLADDTITSEGLAAHLRALTWAKFGGLEKATGG